MSHSKKDAVGGHKGSGIVYDDGYYSHSEVSRRWAKKFNRREARREAKATVREALELLEADVRDAQEELWSHEANNSFYTMIYEDQLEMERLEAEEDARYEEDYCDPYWSDYNDDPWYDDPYTSFFDWDGIPSPSPEPVTVAYHQLNEPVYAAGESLGEILERMMKKG